MSGGAAAVICRGALAPPPRHTDAHIARREDGGGAGGEEVLQRWQSAEAVLTRRLSGARAPARAARRAQPRPRGVPRCGLCLHPHPLHAAAVPARPAAPHAWACDRRAQPVLRPPVRRARLVQTAAPPSQNAPPLPTGSTRLYEDPDIDEYDAPDDVGYWRREISCQDEFVAHHLERGAAVRCGAASVGAVGGLHGVRCGALCGPRGLALRRPEYCEKRQMPCPARCAGR